MNTEQDVELGEVTRPPSPTRPSSPFPPTTQHSRSRDRLGRHRKKNPSIDEVILAEFKIDAREDAVPTAASVSRWSTHSDTFTIGRVDEHGDEQDDDNNYVMSGDDTTNNAGTDMDNKVSIERLEGHSEHTTRSIPLKRQFKLVNKANMKTVRRIQKDKGDRYFDYFETHKQVVGLSSRLLNDSMAKDDIELEIPSLAECHMALHNEEAEEHRKRVDRQSHVAIRTMLDFLAALYVYVTNSIRLETFLVTLNATLATYFFCRNADRYAVKLDFSFLAFSVVFPLTFLIQSTFNRREMALQRLADFKSAVLTAALLTLTVDWEKGGETTGGRLDLPDNFSAAVATDYRDIVQLVYEYLSMPSVLHGRNIVFPKKRLATMRVHALQNDLVKRFNDAMFLLYVRTNEMKRAGFPSGEASRLHQYVQFIQQRFELLRVLKYYRTPQTTRSFGRVYIYVLPWLTGPYFAWVFESTENNYGFVLLLAAFTFLVLLGLLNTQAGLEDPFVVDYESWTPGLDTVKLEFEMANVLQAIDQYYAQAELRRLWTLNANPKLDKKDS